MVATAIREYPNDETYPFGTDDGRIFRTRDAAEAYLTGCIDYCAALAVIPTDRAGNWQIPDTFTRKEYETRAEQFAVEPWSDDEIRRQAYGVRYYQPQTLDHETGLQVVRLGLASRRLNALEDADRRQIAARVPATTALRETCAQCGDAGSMFCPMSDDGEEPHDLVTIR